MYCLTPTFTVRATDAAVLEGVDLTLVTIATTVSVRTTLTGQRHFGTVYFWVTGMANLI